MRIHHQLYRQQNPPRRPALRGARKQLHADMFRMLHGFSVNPPPRTLVRRGETLTPGIITPGTVRPEDRIIRTEPVRRRKEELPKPEEHIMTREERAAHRRKKKELAKEKLSEEESTWSKKERERARESGGAAYGARLRPRLKGLRAGQTIFSKKVEKHGPEVVDPADVYRLGIEPTGRDTSAAWNFLGLIQQRIWDPNNPKGSILSPTGKTCPESEVMWSNIPRVLHPTKRDRVCIPVGSPTQGAGWKQGRFEWFRVKDWDKWDRLVRLRNVTKAAIDKRLSGENLDANLRVALGKLKAGEIKIIQQIMKESYKRKRLPKGKLKSSRLWAASASVPQGPLEPLPEVARGGFHHGPDEDPETGDIFEYAETPWTPEEMRELRMTRAQARQWTPKQIATARKRLRRAAGSFGETSAFHPKTGLTPGRLSKSPSPFELEGSDPRTLPPDVQRRILHGRYARGQVPPEEYREWLKHRKGHLHSDPSIRETQQEVIQARKDIERIKKRIAERTAKEAGSAKHRALVDALLASYGLKGRSLPSYIEDTLTPEEIIETRRQAREADLEYKAQFPEFVPADEGLYRRIKKLLAEEQGGITEKMIAGIKMQRLKEKYQAFQSAVIGDPSTDQKRELGRLAKKISELAKHRPSSVKFGPYPSDKKLDAGATGNYIPATDLTNWLYKMHRIPGVLPSATSKVRTIERARGWSEEQWADHILKASDDATSLENLEVDLAPTKVARELQKRDEERIRLINSTNTQLKAHIKKEWQAEIDKRWKRGGRTDRKPSFASARDKRGRPIADKAGIERRRNNLIKSHRKVVNARHKTALIVIYELMGARALKLSEIRLAKKKHGRVPQVIFEIDPRHPGIRAAYFERSTDPQVLKKKLADKEITKEEFDHIQKNPWIWEIFEPAVLPLPAANKVIVRGGSLIKGYAPTPAHASRSINVAYRIFRTGLKRDKNGEYNSGYDNLSKDDKLWLTRNKPEISKAFAIIILNNSDDLFDRAEADEMKIEKAREEGVSDAKLAKYPSRMPVVQYLLYQSGEFKPEPVKPTKAKEAKVPKEQVQHLRRMSVGEARILTGRGYKIRVKKKAADRFEFQVTTKGGTGPAVRKTGAPGKIEAAARSQAEKKLQAEKKKVASNPRGRRRKTRLSPSSELRGMALDESRELKGPGYRIVATKRPRGKFEFQVFTKGSTSDVTRVKPLDPNKAESQMRAVAGSMLGAQKVVKAFTTANPQAAMRRLNNAARKGLRQSNPSIPREAADPDASFEDMSELFKLPDDPREAHKLGFYLGIIKGIDTCGVQNWVRRKKLRKAFEKRLIEGLLIFQEREGTRTRRGRRPEYDPDERGFVDPWDPSVMYGG